MFKVTINERIKIVRLDLKMTQKEFAKAIKISQPTLSGIESGDVTVIDRNIEMICEKLGVNSEWLRTGEGEMYKQNDDFLESVIANMDNLDEMDKQFFTSYMKLSPDERAVIKKFIFPSK